MARPASSLRVAGVTHTGRRAVNQDCFRVGAVPGSRGRIAFVVVSDGVGGQPDGALASSTAVWTFQQGLRDLDLEDPAGVLRGFSRAVSDANRSVVGLAGKHRDGRKPSATLACALVWGRRAIAANMGDSRIYLVTGQGIRKVSRDHTRLATALRAGHSPEKLEQYRDALNRYLGKSLDIRADIFELKLPANAILFLCSDGVTGSALSPLLPEDVILRELLGRSDIEESVKSIIRLAHERGSKDNITAAAVEVGAPPRNLIFEGVLPALPGESVVAAGPPES